MRPRVPWMNESDDAILEFYEELTAGSGPDIALPPGVIWFNLVKEMGVLDRSRNTISRRMNKLAEIGLLRKVDEERGYYKLTNMGSNYLSGDLDTEDLPSPDEE